MAPEGGQGHCQQGLSCSPPRRGGPRATRRSRGHWLPLRPFSRARRAKQAPQSQGEARAGGSPRRPTVPGWGHASTAPTARHGRLQPLWPGHWPGPPATAPPRDSEGDELWVSRAPAWRLSREQVPRKGRSGVPGPGGARARLLGVRPALTAGGSDAGAAVPRVPSPRALPSPHAACRPRPELPRFTGRGTRDQGASAPPASHPLSRGRRPSARHREPEV